jgi:hypothetical protein
LALGYDSTGYEPKPVESDVDARHVASRLGSRRLQRRKSSVGAIARQFASAGGSLNLAALLFAKALIEKVVSIENAQAAISTLRLLVPPNVDQQLSPQVAQVPTWPARDVLIPLRDIVVRCRLPNVRRAMLDPEHLELPLCTAARGLEVTVPKIEMHSMVIFESAGP